VSEVRGGGDEKKGRASRAEKKSAPGRCPEQWETPASGGKNTWVGKNSEEMVIEQKTGSLKRVAGHGEVMKEPHSRYPGRTDRKRKKKKIRQREQRNYHFGRKG